MMVQCQVCVKDFNRADFAKHECLKDYFMKRLKANEFEVIENLADNLMRLRRSKEGLGLCSNHECVAKYKKSKHYHAGQGMMTPNTTNEPSKCGRCSTIVAGFEDNFFCMYC